MCVNCIGVFNIFLVFVDRFIYVVSLRENSGSFLFMTTISEIDNIEIDVQYNTNTILHVCTEVDVTEDNLLGGSPNILIC